MSELRLVAASSVAPVLWGTTYIVTTQLLPPDRPMLAGVVRAVPAGLLLLAVLAVLAGRSVLPRGAWWWQASVLGAFNITIFFPLLFLGAYRLPGGVAAVISAVGPFVVAVLAFLLLRELPSGRALAGATVGVAGVALLVLQSTTRLDPAGLAGAFFSTVSMAMGTVLGRRWGIPTGFRNRATALLALTAWQLTAGGLLLAPVALLVEGWPPTLTAVNLGAYAYLSFAVTAFAYFLWFRGVTGLGPTQVSVLTLLSPVVASALGWAILAEVLTPWQIVGAVAVLAGVVVGASGGRPIGSRRSRSGDQPDRDRRPAEPPAGARGDRVPTPRTPDPASVSRSTVDDAG